MSGRAVNFWKDKAMGLLPMKSDILPPSDDWVFKLILTAPEAKPVLMDLISAILQRPVKDVIIRNNEIPPGDMKEALQVTGRKA